MAGDKKSKEGEQQAAPFPLCTSSIQGREASDTIQAYTVSITPVCAALMPKPAPMSESSAMGINSVVLKIKAATARVSTRDQARRCAA